MQKKRRKRGWNRDKLQETGENIARHDIIMGHRHARLGSIKKGKEQVMGKQVCGTINHNGDRLVNFCEENDLIIGGTLFNHAQGNTPTNLDVTM
jgi:hypothetical protein